MTNHGGSIVGLPDDDTMLWCRDLPQQIPFWDHVDSQSLWRRGMGEWGHLRAEGCVALKGSGERCTRWLVDGAPFCAFHMERAIQWFLGWAESEHIARARRQIDLDQGRAHEVIRLANEIVSGHAETRVYFFAVPNGPVKIGSSNRPEERVKDFRRGRGCAFPKGLDPSRGELLGHIPGGSSLERSLHRHYAAERIRGTEWFRRTERLDSFIAGALAATEVPA